MLFVQPRDPRLEVKRSSLPHPQAGMGLFAAQPWEQGQKWEVRGILVEPFSVADKLTRYTDRCKWRTPAGLLIPLGYGALVNHSDTPNCEKLWDAERQVLYCEATRRIEAGEEWFLKYETLPSTPGDAPP